MPCSADTRGFASVSTFASATLPSRLVTAFSSTGVSGSFAADGLAARLRLESDPELQHAFSAVDDGELEQGLERLIGAIPATDDGERRDDLRRSVVGVLDELGVEHPVARESRRKLASALY